MNLSKQERPKYYGYRGEYINLTNCTTCDNTGMYLDCNTANCCKHCGGVVVKAGSGKWIKPVYKGYWFWKTLVHPGYWLKAKN